MRRARDRSASLAPLLVIHDAAILLAVFYAPIFWGGFGSSGLTMAATLVSVAALCALVWRWRALGAGPAVIPNAIHLPALIFLAISALSALFSASPHSSALEFSRLVTGAVLFLLVANRALLPAAPTRPVMAIFASSLLVIPFVQTSGETGAWLDVFTALAVICVCAFLIVHRNSPDPVRRWMEALVLSAGLAVALYGVREKVFAHYYLNNPTWQIFSTFFNPNELAGFLALVIPVGVAAALSPQKLWSRLIVGFAALALAIALVPTHSTGAYLAALAALVWAALFLALTSRQARRNFVLVSLACVLAAIAGAVALKSLPGAWPKVAAAFDVQRASNMFRILTWKSTLIMAAHHPWLGVGPAAFKSVYMNYAQLGYTEAAHENYLQVLAEQGVFGVVAFLWLLGAMLFTGWRALRRPGADRGSRLLAAGGMGGVVALMVHSFVDYGWYIGATNLSLWFVAGVLAHLSHGRALAVIAAPVVDDAPRGKRRRLANPSPVTPAPADPVHPLPWPRGAVGRAAALLSLALALCACTWVAARNALAQDTMNQGDAAATAAVTAQQQGDMAVAVQRYREGLAFYQATVGYDAGWSLAHEKLGRVLRGEEGEREIKQALTLEPKSFQPYLTLARSYDDNKRLPEAAQAYEESLARFPQNTRALRLLAETYERMGEAQKALDTYRRLADLDDQPINRYRAVDVDVDTNFAFAYYALGRAEMHTAAKSEAALAWFGKCVAVVNEYFKPNGGAALDQMFTKVGKPRANRAEELLPLKAKALWRVAEISEAAGKPAEAAAKRNEAVAASSTVAQLIAAEDEGTPK